jgi:leucyl aminopeptidase
LCDALTYAERFKPRAVVDIATLTGACVVALGGVRSGLFSSDDALAQSLLNAGERSLDLCWRLPLDDDYADGLKSNFADVANVGGRAGGAVMAAKFLQRFAGKFPWAHLDIAGTAWKGGAAKGSTGRPVALLVEYLLAQAAELESQPLLSKAKANLKVPAKKRVKTANA